MHTFGKGMIFDVKHRTQEMRNHSSIKIALEFEGQWICKRILKEFQSMQIIEFTVSNLRIVVLERNLIDYTVGTPPAKYAWIDYLRMWPGFWKVLRKVCQAFHHLRGVMSRKTKILWLTGNTCSFHFLLARFTSKWSNRLLHQRSKQGGLWT